MHGILMKDVIIIGAGISGCTIAHLLAKRKCEVLVLEKRADAALGASGANSAIIHSGHDPKEGTLKAKFNLLGNRMYEDYCQELQVDFKRIGAFVVASGEEEEKTLWGLFEQARKRAIECALLSGDEVRKREPNVADEVTMGLYLPTTGIITPWEVCYAALEEAKMNDVDVHFNEEVMAIKKEDDHFVVKTDCGEYLSRYVIDCAGVRADEIAGMLGIETYSIRARKGEYYVLDHKGYFTNAIIYPVPSNKGKGVLAVPTIHGNTLLGPTAEFVDDKDDDETTDDLDSVKEKLARTMKNIPYQNVIRNFAGLRPTGSNHDFIIKEDEKVKGFIHVSCIESPGLTAAPAIAKYVVEELLHDQYELKTEFKRRRKPLIMAKLTDEEKDHLIKENPDFGYVVCRCEKISLGEVKDVINRPLGARSIIGVKRRCRPGMGGCQGGFCEPQILEILAKELGIPKEKVLREGPGSEIALMKLKEDL